MLTCIAPDTTHDLAAELRAALDTDTLAAQLGFHLTAASPGEASITAVPDSSHVNAGGTVHGGFLSALADFATGVAVHSRLPGGHYAPHSSLSLQYLRVARPDEVVRCVARCATVGQRAAGAEAELRQGDKLIARAISTHIVVEQRAELDRA